MWILESLTYLLCFRNLPQLHMYVRLQDDGPSSWCLHESGNRICKRKTVPSAKPTFHLYGDLTGSRAFCRSCPEETLAASSDPSAGKCKVLVNTPNKPPSSCWPVAVVYFKILDGTSHITVWVCAVGLLSFSTIPRQQYLQYFTVLLR